MEVELDTEGLQGSREEVKNYKDLVDNAYSAMGSGCTFNRILKGCRVVSAVPPAVLVELVITDDHVNGCGVVHAGFIAAMVDILTASSARLMNTNKDSPIVSIDLSVAYLLPMQKDDLLLMEARCLGEHRSVAFTEAIFRRKSDDAVIIKAKQQLAILNYRSISKDSNKLRTEDEAEKEENKGRKKEEEKRKKVEDKERKEEEDKGRKKEGEGEQANTTKEGEKFNGWQDGGAEFEQHDLKGRAQRAFGRMGQSGNFNKVAIGRELRVIKAEPANLVVEMKLEKTHLNEGGTMHGGFTASMVDIVSSAAVAMTEPNCPTQSMDISVSYMLPATIGEWIVIEAKCLKVGRNIAFTDTSLSRKRDGALLAKGKHNLHMLRERQGPKAGEMRN